MKNLAVSILCLIRLNVFASAADLSAVLSSASTIPVTASSYTANGNANITLGYAPTTGAALMIVQNIGLDLIQGRFANLQQGQLVKLTYQNVTYNYVANYYGGSGNDLMLVWAEQKIYSWGDNKYGQLGNIESSSQRSPVEVSSSGVLAGKTIFAVEAGGDYLGDPHSLALCSDGTIATWCANCDGELGNGDYPNSSLPVDITQSGVLAGKTVIAVAAGARHSLALCSDGTVAAWGSNFYGELGNNGTLDSRIPVAVSRASALSGKTVVAISAGRYHNLALCSDGTVAAWGRNSNGELGNNGTLASRIPVAVSRATALFGKTVVAISAGGYHNLALCSDGIVAAWGSNSYGELGNNGTTGSGIPVAVAFTGVLSGKKIVEISAGAKHNLVIFSDGTVAAWGDNYKGQLGNNGETNNVSNGDYSSEIPVAVTQSGLLSGKTIRSVSAGMDYSMALCTDGSVAAWGSNLYGELGIGSFEVARFAPELIKTYGNLASNCFVKVSSGDTYSLAIVVRNTHGANLGSLNVEAANLVPAFDANIISYSTSVPNSTKSIKLRPTLADSNASVKVNGVGVASGSASASLPLVVGLNTITTVVTAQDGSTSKTYTVKVTRAKSSDATLSGLVVKSATLSPAFKPAKAAYTASIAIATTAVRIRATAADDAAKIKINGTTVASGALSKALPMDLGKNLITIAVTAQDGTTKSYKITVTRGVSSKSALDLQATLAAAEAPAGTHVSKVTENRQRYQQLTVVKPDPAARYVIEVSPDLVNWFSGERHTTVVTDDDRILTVRDNTPIKEGVKRFIRVNQ